MEPEERLGTPPTTQDIKSASHCWKLMDHEMFHPLERFWK
jgi:hypothetical protein